MKVYKYRGGDTYFCSKRESHRRIFERDLESLKEDFFWAPTRHNLNDPFECMFDDKVSNFISQLRTIPFLPPSDDLESALNELYKFVDISGIYSLSQTPLSELLWAHYANSHLGFCIEYDLSILNKYKIQNINTIKISYQDNPPTATLQDVFNSEHIVILEKMFGHKSKAWEYEEEIRIITQKSGRLNYDYRAVTGVYFGLNMKNEDKIEIMKALKGRNIQYYQVELISNSYKLKYKEVENPFINSERYMNTISEINEEVINFSDLNYAKYNEYLRKAAEIIRRDPYCQEITDVSFSSEKSTLDNPIVYIWYETKFSFPHKEYFTLQEIDDGFSKIDGP